MQSCTTITTVNFRTLTTLNVDDRIPVPCLPSLASCPLLTFRSSHSPISQFQTFFVLLMISSPIGSNRIFPTKYFSYSDLCPAHSFIFWSQFRCCFLEEPFLDTTPTPILITSFVDFLINICLLLLFTRFPAPGTVRNSQQI